MCMRTTWNIFCTVTNHFFLSICRPKQRYQSPGLSPGLGLLRFQARPKPTSSPDPGQAWLGLEWAGLSGLRAWGPARHITMNQDAFMHHWIERSVWVSEGQEDCRGPLPVRMRNNGTAVRSWTFWTYQSSGERVNWTYRNIHNSLVWGQGGTNKLLSAHDGPAVNRMTLPIAITDN